MRDLLKKRGLDSSGRRSALLARLHQEASPNDGQVGWGNRLQHSAPQLEKRGKVKKAVRANVERAKWKLNSGRVQAQQQQPGTLHLASDVATPLAAACEK